MNRRSLLGVGLTAALIGLGRWIRRRLLIGPDGAWREPGFLASWLEPLPETAAAPSRPDEPAGPIDINAAPADTLVLLPGVGPVLAARIVAEREAGGPFATWGDLQRVRGIGPALARRMAAYIIIPQCDGIEQADASRAP